jgi:holo-[acyl-carrier protein] synthase
MLYHGIDMVEIVRLRRAVERWGDRFLQRVFTPNELKDCGVTDGLPRFESLAARWAAKEATAKALSLGLSGLAAGAGIRLGWHEIEVVRGAEGQPLLRLHGAAARALGRGALALSLSHTNEHAIASVIGRASDG